MIAIEISKNDKGFYNVTQVRPKGAQTASAGAVVSSNTTSSTVGIKVGAARNQAIAFLSATKGKSFTLDDVDQIAYEIVSRQAAQEKIVASGKNPFDKTEESADVDVSDDAVGSDEIPF